MSTQRELFSSRLGFVLAAAGSAVGLGNIWGFPTQAASNGGGAFLLVYLLLAFLLAYPILMVELVIGRHARANPLDALRATAEGKTIAPLGAAIGGYGVLIASLILSFYAIVGGWMVSHALQPIATVLDQDAAASWLIEFSNPRNILFTTVFMALTVLIVARGVKGGIEKWSSRLMPLLIGLLVLLIVYVLTLEGAMEGLTVYLVPDFSQIASPQLIISALGSAFFSLSLGVGTMMIYGSYIDEKESLPQLGGIVTGLDVAIAVMAGFLIMPAMYVALASGVEIYAADGSLISEDTLIFTVLPALFNTMELAGLVVGFVFFALMSIAAVTSSISMLEVPVALMIEKTQFSRTTAAWLCGAVILCISTVILFNFGDLFGAVIAFTTRYSQPLLGMMFCLWMGWVWHRSAVLAELQRGAPAIESSLFWKVWPNYVKIVCPIVIVAIIWQSF